MKKLFASLAGSSVLWGLVATFLFYFCLNAGLVKNETIVRYSTGHPVEYATIAMFWVGLVDLLLKIWTTRRECRSLKRGALFPPKRREKEPLSRVDEYLETISKALAVRGSSLYLTRLTDALNFLKYGGSPDDLDQELRCLADDAYDAREADYGMVRTFIWAIPILGFLGTVLGITVALGSLDLTRLEATGETLASGLKVAFDTTALALSLVFVVYFLQFFSRKQDSALASGVARLVNSELQGRFLSESNVGVAAEELETTRRFLKSVSETFEEATRAQTTIWSETMSNAAQKSAELSYEAANRFGSELDKRLLDGSAAWTQSLTTAQRDFVENAIRPVLEETSKRVARLDALEDKIERQMDALHDVLQASADVASIEERLASALEKIAEVGEFEKTLNNLSATVCLLNSKLTSGKESGPDVVRLDAALERRASRRNEALAALEQLEQSIGTVDAEAVGTQPVLFPNLEEPAKDPEQASIALQDEAPKPKRTRSTIGKKRSA